MLFECPLGTVEEFTAGRTMTHAEMRTDAYSAQIARQLRRLHDAGFVHLDLHHKNMLIDGENAVRFIDCEYCATATERRRQLDLANHWSEWAYDYDAEDWHVPRPTTNIAEHMRRFLGQYLEREPTEQELLDVRHAMGAMYCRWMAWALSYYETTQAPQYLLYASERAAANAPARDDA